MPHAHDEDGGLSAFSGFDPFDLADTSGPTLEPALVAEPRRTRLPSGRTPERETLRVDRKRSAELAGYGPEPENLFATLLYSWRVRQRRRALAVSLTTARQALEAVERARDAELDRIARSLLGLFGASPQFAELTAALAAADEAVVASERAVTETAEQAQARLADQERRRLELQEELAEARRRIEQHGRTTTETAAARRRVEARAARVRIELRSLAERAANTGADVSTEKPAFEAEATALAPEVAELSAADDAARLRLRDAEDTARAVERALAAAAVEREVEAMSGQTRLAGSREAVGAARERAVTAHADAARALLAAPDTWSAPDFDFAPAAAADVAVQDAAVALATLEHAEASFDAEACRRGGLLALSGGAVLLVVALGLLLLALR